MTLREHISDIKTFGLRLWLHDRWQFTWSYHMWYDHIKPIFWPRHPELRAAVPRTWHDLDTCIEEFLYAAVISYVEKEKGLEMWEAQDPEHEAKKRASELRECYEWAKTGRKAFQERVNAAYPPAKCIRTEFARSYDELYGEVDRLEREFVALDDKWLMWIVQWRRHMWT